MEPRAMPASLILDAYTADEFGPKNTPATIDPARPRGTPLLSKSRFTTVTAGPGGGVVETPQTLRQPIRNKANPRFNPALTGPHRQTNIPASDADTHASWLFLSPSTMAHAAELGPSRPWDRPIQVSILYGVGFEMNRHGLRTAVAARTEPSALILVPGIEPTRRQPHRWGVGIAETDLRRLLETAVGRPVTYRTKVLAAYSTGINGLNQTLLHGLVDASRAERIVIYDCLYTNSSGPTAAALKKARDLAGLNLKIVVYKCTTGGNSLGLGNRLSVVAQNPALIPSAGVIEQLFYHPAYNSLITFRSLEGGIADGLVSLPAGSGVERAFTALKAIAPARGTVVSSERAWRHVHGTAPPSTSVVFETWARDTANRPVIRDFQRHLGSVKRPGTIRHLIWSNQLPGWPGGDGEENHDLLLPDFSWEYLPA
ncbi:hypothetical protein ACQEU3_38710 [Spirillospora sp. CA-253888]